MCATACIGNGGLSAKLKVSAFNKSRSLTKSEVLFNPLLLISYTQNVVLHYNKPLSNDKIL